VRIPFRHGETILHVAARKNWTPLCRWLLQLGADVNRADILGRAALHYAAQFDAAKVAKFLIERGADLNQRDWKGRPPLELAECGDNKTTASIIRKEISMRSSNRIKGLKFLLDRKCD